MLKIENYMYVGVVPIYLQRRLLIFGSINHISTLLTHARDSCTRGLGLNFCRIRTRGHPDINWDIFGLAIQ